MNPTKTNSDAATAHSTPNAEPVIQQPILIPASRDLMKPAINGMVEPAAEPESAINVRSVLQALRRRWFSGLLLGSVLGAITAYIVWELVPAPYTAFTEIRVKSVMPTVPLKSANRETQFETLKQTHMQMVRNRDVLETALRDEGVAALSFFRESDDDQVEQLQRKLEVKSNSIEFFRISLSGQHPEELKKIVLAVTKAYDKVVVSAEGSAINDRIKRYEKIFGKEDVKLQGLREGLQLLVKDDATSSKQFVERQRGILSERASLRQQLGDTEIRIMKLKIMQQLQKEQSAGTSKESPSKTAGAPSVPLKQAVSKDEQPAVSAKRPGPKGGAPTSPLKQSAPKSGVSDRRAPELASTKEESATASKPPVPPEFIDAALAEDTDFRRAKSKVEELKNRLERQRKTLTPNHPDIARSEADLAAAKKELDTLRKKIEPKVRKRLEEQLRLQYGLKNKMDLDVELKALERQRDYLKAELEKRKIEQLAAGLNDVQIQRQTEEIEVQRKYTQALKDEIARMRAQKELGAAEPRVIVPERAEVSSRPNTKKKYMGTAVAGFGMFGFVLGGILLLDIRLKRISSIQQVVGRMGLPIVGAIPSMPRLATTKQGGDWSSKARYWHSVLTESVDSARTVVIREAEQNKIKILMIASAMGGEGKTTVSCHLATSLARAGRNVLLIDGDMRRPTVHRTFDIGIQPGFAELLTGDAELDDALQVSDIPGLTILPAGRLSQKALEELAQERPGEILAELRTRFEFIILDSAPILPVTDSLLVAQLVDAVLFTIRRDVSRASKVLAGCERLHKLGVPLLGAIAVGLDDESYGYGYSYRYGYGYDPYHSTPRS